MNNDIVVYQGVEGAYSHLVSLKSFPTSKLIPLSSFYECMEKVEHGEANFAVIPIENSSAGRVEEIYRLIPKMKLYIVGEYFQPIKHALLSLKNVNINEIKTVSSHPQALAQCEKNIKNLGLTPYPDFDTAGSAMNLQKSQKRNHAVIASKLCAEIYNLDILKENFADHDGNVTRFIILSKYDSIPSFEKDKLYITSLVFTLKNIPASLYKALGGFATNGIDLIKIESYSVVGSVYSTIFHIDLYGHVEEKRLQLALNELKYFSEECKVIGVYERNNYRNKM